ncbi:MAG TPA: hypothetical protein VL738_19540 [Dactylosporangium sp.]|jgi:pyridoxine/pyridoxamine 5'-phosphate oxidase|nr:hypothetical protein [Dactylosporangium sp.]
MAIETLSGDASLILPEFDDPPADPIGLLRGWLDAAIAAGVREPYSIVLDRLHRRLRYDRHPTGWTPQRLQP